MAGIRPAGAADPVVLFCGRLRRLQKTTGVTGVRLAAAAEKSTSQVSDILNGRIRRTPAWDVVEAIVAACLAHAEKTGRLVPPDLGDVQDWRRRYFDLEQDQDARTHLSGGVLAPDEMSRHAEYSGPAEVLPVVPRLEAWVVVAVAL